ncbi:7947_t:CDS:2 [Acaulospora colombiana]|uniref:7947_t:CDS:1 n=1 Tax=Acaulospora colombiana TaxID=27376 RepID=A0ACA9NFR0_9GLOM|nr:7947_t:CDS:2 [Acaulospora colombiana]
MIRALNFDLKTPLLNDGFTGDLVIPSDPDYQTAIVRFAKNAQRNAALVAFVRSPGDVSRVIHFASENSIPLVVRGGGHSTSGSSSIEGGIVIDLSRYMNRVRVDEENKLGYVGGGANWKDVDEEAIKYGLATVGGTVNHTGVGGLTLGGGYGWLTGEYGMAIDNLVQATLVTADGTIRKVDEATDSDLFWAIRGGGTNFGCVTEFVYRLHPQRSMVYAGPLVFPPPRIKEVVTAVEEWYKTSSETEGIILVMTTKGPTGEPGVVVSIFFNGEEEEGKQKFKKILDLGPVANLATMIPYEKLNGLHNEAIPYNINTAISGTLRGSLPPSSASAIFDQMLALANAPSKFKSISPETKQEEENKLSMMILWEYWNLKKQSTPAPDATAFLMRVPYPVAPTAVFWSSDDLEAAREARERLKALRGFCDAELRPTFGPDGPVVNGTGYGNSAASAEALFGANYPRLQDIKAKYDPNLMFHSWFPIQPKPSSQRRDMYSSIKNTQAAAKQFLEETYSALYA